MNSMNMPLRRVLRWSPVRKRLPAALALALVAFSCDAPNHTFNVVAGPHVRQYDRAIVRVDGKALGILEPEPYVDVWPLNCVSELSDHRWAVLHRRISKISFGPGREHRIEIVPPNGASQSVSFTVDDMTEPKFINFGVERNGTLAGIVYHRDGSMTYFPAGRESLVPHLRGQGASARSRGR